MRESQLRLLLVLLTASLLLNCAYAQPLPSGTPVGGPAARPLPAPRSAASAQRLVEPPRPQRHPRNPVDLSDSHACVLELADLCTYPFVENQYTGPNMHGSEFVEESIDDDLTVRELDATVRFDHLEESSNEDIRKLVRQARPLIEDTWRFCRDAQYYGWHRRFREQFNIEQHQANNMMAATFNWIVDDASLASTDDWFPAIPGRAWTSTPEYEARREAKKKTLAEDARKFGTAYGKALEQWQRGLDLDKIWQERLDLFCLARGIVYDKLTAFWDGELIPRLVASASPAGKLVGPNYGEPLVDPGLRPATYRGMVSLVNISGHTLNNVVVKLECQGYFGDVSHWRGFMPVFPAKARIYALPRDGAARLMERALTDWKAKADIYTGQENQEGLEVLDFDKGNELFKFRISHPGAADPPNQGVSPILKQQRDGYAKTNRDLMTRAPGFLTNLQSNYAAPVNPDGARIKLLTTLKPDTDYQIDSPEDNRWSTETLHIGRISDASPMIDVVLTAKSADDGKTAVFQLKGRLNEDADSGCVLGIASPEDSLRLAAEFSSPYIRMVTSPIDLISCAQDRFIRGGNGDEEQPDVATTVIAAFGRGPDRNSVPSQYKAILQNERAHQLLCKYAIYLERDGKLGLQFFSMENENCSYSHLMPGRK